MNLRKDHYRGEAPAALLLGVNYRAIDTVTELTGCCCRSDVFGRSAAAAARTAGVRRENRTPRVVLGP